MDLFDHLLFGDFLGKPGWMWLAFIGILAAGLLVSVLKTCGLEAAR